MNVNGKFFLQFFLLISFCSVSVADMEEVRGQSVVERARNEYDPLGIRLGSFLLFPKLEAVNKYDNNIFKRDGQNQKRADYIFHVNPSVVLQSDWNNHSAYITARGDAAYHAKFQEEDWQDFFVTAGGQYDILRNSFVNTEVSYARQHEGRGSPDSLGSAALINYYTFGHNFQAQHKVNRIRLHAENDIIYFDYNDAKNGLTGAKINHYDRNRYKNLSTFTLGYEINPNYEAFVSGSYNRIHYVQTRDDFGLERGSHGYEVLAGINLDLTGKLTGDIYAGFRHQDYDDGALQTIEGVTGGFGLVWNPTGLTTVTARMDREVKETTQGQASGYFNTVTSLRVDHELLRNFLINANSGYTDNRYEGASAAGQNTREEDIYSVGFGGKYLFNRNFYIEGAYTWSKRDVNLRGADYEDNTVYMTLGTQL